MSSRSAPGYRGQPTIVRRILVKRQPLRVLLNHLLLARRENKTTRWERRSKIFGSSKSVNCLVGDLIVESNLQILFQLCQFLEYPGTNTRTLLQWEYSLL